MNKRDMKKDEDLLNRLKVLAEENGGDTENLHCDMDDALCEELKARGYTKSVEFFMSIPKWYA